MVAVSEWILCGYRMKVKMLLKQLGTLQVESRKHQRQNALAQHAAGHETKVEQKGKGAENEDDSC